MLGHRAVLNHSKYLIGQLDPYPVGFFDVDCGNEDFEIVAMGGELHDRIRRRVGRGGGRRRSVHYGTKPGDFQTSIQKASYF